VPAVVNADSRVVIVEDTTSGETRLFKVRPSTTMGCILEAWMSQRGGVPGFGDRYRVVFVDGIRLDASHRVSDLELVDGEVLRIFLHPKQSGD